MCVVLCARNADATIGEQLAALATQDYQGSWDLIVVDNGSTDTTREVVTGWSQAIPHLRLVTEPEAGLSRARNRGVAESRAPLVACCDADDVVSTHWLGATVDALARFDLVGGLLETHQLNPAGSPRDAVLQLSELPTVFGRAYSMGAGLGFRRSAFDLAGGFDETFPIGSDDTDFCLRAQYAGCSIGFVPDAVIHYRVRTTARAVMRQRFAYGRGHEHLVAKHARLGMIQSRVAQRWKLLAVASARLLRLLPQLLDGDLRLQYLASVGYFGGRLTELGRETIAVAAEPVSRVGVP